MKKKGMRNQSFGDYQSESERAKASLKGVKSILKGKRYAKLVHPDPKFKNAIFEVEQSKYERNKDRYAAYQNTGYDTW